MQPNGRSASRAAARHVPRCTLATSSPYRTSNVQIINNTTKDGQLDVVYGGSPDDINRDSIAYMTDVVRATISGNKVTAYDGADGPYLGMVTGIDNVNISVTSNKAKNAVQRVESQLRGQRQSDALWEYLLAGQLHVRLNLLILYGGPQSERDRPGFGWGGLSRPVHPIETHDVPSVSTALAVADTCATPLRMTLGVSWSPPAGLPNS